MHKINIIILNYLSYEDSINITHQLLKQKNIELKIIIVDNNSPNSSFNILQKEFKNHDKVVVLFSNINGGYGSGNNIGLNYISREQPEYVGILNNDINLNDNLLLSKLINLLAKDDNAYFCSPLMKVNGTIHRTAFKIKSIYFSLLITPKLGEILFSKLNYYRLDDNPIQKVECLPGSFFVSRYKSFKSLGFFDERTFLFEEETILAYKIRNKSGYNILCKALDFEHNVSKTINQKYTRITKLKEKHKSLNIFYEYYAKPPKILRNTLIFAQKFRILEEKIILWFKGLI